MLGVTNIAITKHRVTGMHPRRLFPSPHPLVFRALGRIGQVGEGKGEEGTIFPSKPRKLRYMWNSFSKFSWGWRIFEANPTVCESVPGGGRH